MNKRLKKKRHKVLEGRYEFIRKLHFRIGRGNGKSRRFFILTKALLSWKYKPFKDIRKGIK